KVQAFAPHAGNMEAQGIATAKILFGTDFILGKPTCVRKRELHFVAVKVLLRTAQDREGFKILNATNPFNMVKDLILFNVQLLFVGKILPLAAAAYAEMDALGFHAERRTFKYFYGFGFKVVGFRFFHARVYAVARNCARHEHGFALCGTAYSNAFGTCGNKLNIFEYLIFSSVFRHAAKVRFWNKKTAGRKKGYDKCLSLILGKSYGI